MAKKNGETTSTHVEHEAEKVQRVERDEMAQLIRDAVNKASKDGSIVAYDLSEHEDPSCIVDWISTGSTTLDLAISNRPHGGLPVGRMTELNGLEGTGKSLIAAHVLAETQKKDGIAIMIDTESAAAPDFWQAVGVKIPNLVYINLTTVEDIFNYIEHIIGTVRKANKDKLVCIVVDSLAAASSEKELETDHGVDGYNTSKAIVISKAMRKITNLISQQRVLLVFTNQLRMNMSTFGFGDKFVVPGGKSKDFHYSVRVRLLVTGKIKKGDDIVGVECEARITKNRLGPPQRRAYFNIFFDSGIQDLSSWWEYLKENKLVDKAEKEKTKKKLTKEEKDAQKKKDRADKSKVYEIELPSGVVKLTTSQFVEKVNNDAAFKDEVYQLICNDFIMKYRDPNSKIDEDVDVDTEDKTGDD
jgi:recombination protein RecA